MPGDLGCSRDLLSANVDGTPKSYEFDRRALKGYMNDFNRDLKSKDFRKLIRSWRTENHWGKANHLGRLEKLKLIRFSTQWVQSMPTNESGVAELDTYSGKNSKRVGKRELDTEVGPV